MTDGSDVVQRREGEDLLDPTKGVVDLGHAPAQDLWNMNDDVFKPLMNWDDAPKNDVSIFDKPMDFVPEPIGHSQTAARRRPVVTEAAPVAINSHSQTMPRVMWKPRYSPFKKLKKTIENFVKKVQLTLSGIAVFLVWTLALAIAVRIGSTYLFAFDPVSIDSWRLIENLYNSGSTFQWGFVVFYLAAAIAWPVVGVALAITKATSVKPIMDAIMSPIIFLWQWPERMAYQQKRREEERRLVGKPVNPVLANPVFKKPPEEAPMGGHIGGTGSGGGHGRPSWQGGPANTQAFPRAEQGRR